MMVGGAVYGLIWWIVGWNVIMPLLNGASILQLHIGPSFYGHMIFGHTLAFIVLLRDAAIGMSWEHYSDDYVVRLPRLEHPAGYNYGATSSSRPGQVKHGRTNNPRRRLSELKRDYGTDTKYRSIKVSDNAPRDEKRLHKRLNPLRRIGEFFDVF